MKVDFMIIGAQKCGTTGIASRLAAHPEVAFCREKEPGYFNQQENWEEDLDQYHILYSPKNGQICGEASTMYTFTPEYVDTHKRLHQYNPDLKLIYIMRNPVKRVISNYSHRLVRGTVTGPPEEEIFSDPIYISRSRYAAQIRPYLDLFPRDNVLMLVFEDFFTDQTHGINLIAEFLGISPHGFLFSTGNGRHQSIGVWYLKGPYRKFVRNRALGALISRIPEVVKQSLRPFTSRKLDQRPYFSETLRNDIWLSLEGDVNRLEEILDRRLDVWREKISEVQEG